MIRNTFICCLLLIFALSCLGQDNLSTTEAKWTRIVTENKEISLDLPADFLVDAEKKDFDGQRLRLNAVQNGVQMEILIYNVDNPKKYLQQIRIKGESKKIGDGDDGFLLKRLSSNEEDKFFADTFFLASKKNFYILSIFAENGNKPEISRFFYSVKTRGKSIFINKNGENERVEKSISIAELKTSPEVLTALNQTDENSDRKIKYEFKKIDIKEPAVDFSIQEPIILISPYLSGKSYSVRPTFFASRVGQNSGEATFKVKLLSNGKVGDITVYSMSDRRILYEFVEGIKRVRFLPAVKNGKAVDFEWNFGLETDNF
jgi:hypothetical protein